MPPTEHRNVRTALLVNFHRNESPSPSSLPAASEWVEVPNPNSKTLWEKFFENCKCECAGDRSSETPKCIIS